MPLRSSDRSAGQVLTCSVFCHPHPANFDDDPSGGLKVRRLGWELPRANEPKGSADIAISPCPHDKGIDHLVALFAKAITLLMVSGDDISPSSAMVVQSLLAEPPTNAHQHPLLPHSPGQKVQQNCLMLFAASKPAQQDRATDGKQSQHSRFWNRRY